MTRSSFRRGNISAAKLTPSQVLSIRQRYNDGESQGALAREFAVSVGQIGRIVRGEVWQDYSQPEAPSTFEHRRATPPSDDDITQSAMRLEELLQGSPKALLDERCTHGIRRGQFCMDCAAEDNRGLDRLMTEAKALTPEIEQKAASDLDKFLGPGVPPGGNPKATT